MVAIGIDLGTTYSCVARWHQGAVEIFANEQGSRTTASYVAFTEKDRLIGDAAKTQSPANTANTVFGVKRLIGRRYDDLNVQMDLRHFPFKVTNDNNKPTISVEYKGAKKNFVPEEISAMVLYKMKQIAETCIGETVTDAVITIPAYFNDSQRQATKIAGIIAGLNVIRIINEPTAAALAFGVQRQLKGEKNVLIYDLGGGTFDVSVLRIAEGSIFEVKATAGKPRLGGEDFDMRLVSFFALDFEKKYGISMRNNQRAMKRLKASCERAKRCLSSCTEASVDVESLHNGIDYSGKISKAMFEELCGDLFKDTLDSVETALQDAQMTKEDIDEIVLVGGSTRIPKIRSLLHEYFGKPLNTSINPDEAIAYGAAIQAAILGGEDPTFKDFLLLDVVPLSLGIETDTGMLKKVVERNTAIPCRKTKTISTCDDYQTSVLLKIYEGERTRAEDNNLLGSFELDGIPPTLRGVPQVDVQFDMDANGILTVFVKDQSTGNNKTVVINHDNRLRPKEVDEMIASAIVYRAEDEEERLRLETRNRMETYLFDVKHKLHDNAGNFEESELEMMKIECGETFEWIEENSSVPRGELEMKFDELMKRWGAVLDKCYSTSKEPKRSRHSGQMVEIDQATIEEVLNNNG